MVDTLARDRAEKIGLPETFERMRADLMEQLIEAIQVVDKYMNNGEPRPTLKKLKNMRRGWLAHRQLNSTMVSRASAADDIVLEFYQDNSELIQKLMSLVNAPSYDPEDTAQVYRHYAMYFWSVVR